MAIYAYFSNTSRDVKLINDFTFNRKVLDSTFTLESVDGSETRRMTIRDIKSLIGGLYIGDQHASVLMPLAYIVPHKESNEKFLLLLDSPCKIGIICKNILTRVVLDYNGLRIIDINDSEHDNFDFKRKRSCE